MQDIMSAIETIKKLEYSYLYEEFANFNMYPTMTDYSNIILKILLADMQNLNIFYGNGLQFMFLLIEEALFIDELIYEGVGIVEGGYSHHNYTLSDDIAGLSMYYKHKRFDSKSKDFFHGKILKFDDNKALQFICNIVWILNYKGNFETLGNSIYAILTSDVEDYYKAYNIMNLLNTKALVSE